MATFVKLTPAGRGGPTWINLDLVARMDPVDSFTTLVGPHVSTGDGFIAPVIEHVKEAPAEILALLGELPEDCRAKRCDYYGYYLAHGEPELTHEGYHAAEVECRRHMDSCRGMSLKGVCSICTGWERRLRA